MKHYYQISTKMYHAWKAWCSMKGRCHDKKREYHGAKGISYDPRWEDFYTFFEDMGQPMPGMTLDRRDNTKDYSKENCRWATRSEQSANQQYRWDKRPDAAGLLDEMQAQP